MLTLALLNSISGLMHVSTIGLAMCCEVCGNSQAKLFCAWPARLCDQCAKERTEKERQAEKPWRVRKSARGQRVKGVPLEVYEPTADEIEAACAAIRRAWAPGEHERRRLITPEIVNGKDPLAVVREARAAMEAKLLAVQMVGGAA